MTIELCEVRGQKDFILVTYRHNDKLKTGLYKSISELMRQYNLTDNPTSDWRYSNGIRTNFKSPLDKSLAEYYHKDGGSIYNESLNKFFNSFDYDKIKLDYKPAISNYSRLITAFKNSKNR